ncbi:H-NS family nucleoid-associated regulatory protein [Rhodoferax sp.]|uniref:H-NS histone family protein n=1 Tax=Rhodoferax sp. TaxID=50421 RepID=UPI00374CFF27
MPTYKELLQQRELLEQKISEARTLENAEAIEKVKALVADFGLTAEDIFSNGKTSTKTKSVVKVAPKYRNPATGDTWTGRGKPPKWIQDQERNQFLIA